MIWWGAGFQALALLIMFIGGTTQGWDAIPPRGIMYFVWWCMGVGMTLAVLGAVRL